jgi:hypothetical protein
MAFFVYLLVYVAAFLLSELFKPTPDTENAKPAGLGDFNVPTATEGRAVPIIWGTVELAAPNVIWYGDLRTQRIREKIKTGMFSSKKITVGYQYYLGIQFGLCRGPFNGPHDGLLKIRIDDTVVFQSSPIHASGSFAINEPELYGEDAGGISGTLSFFPGTSSQARSTYLENVLQFSPDILPAYRGTCYIIAEQIYVGNSPSLRPWKFELRRIPDGLGLATGSPGTGTELINGRHANPMNVLFEALTDSEWGLSINPASIDQNTLKSHAQTLYDEGIGFSAILDRQRKVKDIIAEIERLVDGVLTTDPDTGLHTFILIRESDIPSPLSSLPLVDESNAANIEFSRPAWSETTNSVRVKYFDPDQDYKESFALAQDMANRIIQGDDVIVTEQFMGLKDKAAANFIAWRDLRTLAYPLAKVSFMLKRELYTLKPGSLFRFSWSSLGISELLMRVNRIQVGNADDNMLSIDAIEDVFVSQAASFGNPIDSNWTVPTQTVSAIDADDQLIFEAPKAMNDQDPDDPELLPRVVTLARLNSGDGYEVHTQQAASKSALGATYTENLGPVPDYVRVGTLRTAIPGAGGSLPAQGVGDIFIDPLAGDDLSELIDSAARTTTDMNNLLTLVYIAPPSVNSPDELRDYGEFVIYSQALESIGGSPQVTGLELRNCYRGCLDTVPKAWPVGSRVWFVGFAGAGLSSQTFTDSFWVRAKLLPTTQESGALPIASATPTNPIVINDGFRYYGPMPPAELFVGSRYNTSASFSVSGTNAFTLSWLRRNWRTVLGLNNILGDNNDGTDFEPGAADSGDGLYYRVEIYDEASPSQGLIIQRDTPVDSLTNNNEPFDVNDIMGAVGSALSGTIRAEIEARHAVSSPETISRVRLTHSFDWNITGFSTANPDAVFLGRIPYGTVVSPSFILDKAGSPGSPKSIPLINIRMAYGARLNDGPGTGNNGRIFIVKNGGSPGQLIFDGQGVSPYTTILATNISNPDASPSEWQGVAITFLHYHHTGRPIWIAIQDQSTNRLLAYAILEPLNNTIPESINV